MNKHGVTGLFRFSFGLSLFVLLAMPSPVRALDWYWGSHPDKERLVLVLDGPTSSVRVARTGTRRVDVTLPSSELAQKPAPLDLSDAKLLTSVTLTNNGVAIGLSTNGFGYVQFPLEGTGKVVIDVFRDSIGARWKPRSGQKSLAAPAGAAQTKQAAATTQPQKTATQKTAQKFTLASPASRPVAPVPAPKEENLGENRTQTAQRPAPRPAPSASAAARRAPVTIGPSTDSKAAGTTASAPATAPMQPQKTAVAPAPATGAGNTSSAGQRPFFSVPYVFRSPLNSGGPGSWEQFEQSTPKTAVPMPVPASQPVPEPPLPAAASNVTAPATAMQGLNTTQLEQATGEQATAVQPEQQPAPEPPPPPMAPEAADQFAQGTTNALSQYNAPISRPVQPGQSIMYKGRLSWAPPPELATQGVKTDKEAKELAKSLADVSREAMEEVEAEKELQAIAEKADEQSVGKELEQAGESMEQAAMGEGTGDEGPKVALNEEGEPLPEGTPVEGGLVGKDGEVVDFDTLLMEAKVELNNENYDKALEGFRQLKLAPNLPEQMREEVLYTYAEATYAKYKEDFKNNFQKITEAFTEAMNHDLKSMRVPGTLLQLGLFNLRVDNVREAEAYFNILKDKFPYDDNIPLIYYYWGDYFFKNKKFQKAADNFQFVVQNYPDSKFVREASVGLAESLIKLDYEKQAFQIVDYIEKRWPRFYIEYLPFMRLLADVNYKLGNYPKARVNYWTYYNLDPEGDYSDIVLARLGDIYVQNNQIPAAREVYQKAVTQFPDKDGGLISQMRLAEEGIYDEPSVEQMFTVFDRPFTLSPAEVYQKIVEQYPDSDLAPLAQVKLAMWRLWNKKYRQSIAEVEVFEEKFPDSKLLRRAREVALQSFQEMVEVFSAEKNYESIIRAWNEFPVVRAAQDMLPPDIRVALAYSFWQKGQPDEAVALADPLLKGHKVKKFSEVALQMVLTIYSQSLAWDRIPPLEKRIELWELSAETQRELNYAMALAYENMGRPEKAQPLWTVLADDRDLDVARQAYALYFLAQDARRNRDLGTAYQRAQDSLTFFYETKSQDSQKIKDLLGLLMDVTESSGRVREALGWAGDYSKYVEKGDVDWPALQYRMAQLYKKSADTGKWETILTELKRDMPQSLYGRMAASELQAHQLEKNAKRYAPTGSL